MWETFLSPFSSESHKTITVLSLAAMASWTDNVEESNCSGSKVRPPFVLLRKTVVPVKDSDDDNMVLLSTDKDDKKVKTKIQEIAVDYMGSNVYISKNQSKAEIQLLNKPDDHKGNIFLTQKFKRE